jgi:ribosomal protein S18 acetylase RimI-like enzyme
MTERAPAPTSAGRRRKEDRVVLRPAAPADATTIAGLAGELGYPATAIDVIRRLAALPDHDEVLVADSGGGVVGWIHCSLARSLLVEPHVQVLGIVVAREWRGRGIGRRLMVAAEDLARRRGVAFVRLRSRVEREGAHAFYEALGYRQTKTQTQFVRELAPPDEPRTRR